MFVVSVLSLGSGRLRVEYEKMRWYDEGPKDVSLIHMYL